MKNNVQSLDEDAHPRLFNLTHVNYQLQITHKQIFILTIKQHTI